MNQILATDIEKNKKNKKASTRSIVIIFCIFLITFGLGTTVAGGYSYYKNIINKSNNDLLVSNSTKPRITLERESANSINIVVTHDKEISSVKYTINEELIGRRRENVINQHCGRYRRPQNNDPTAGCNRRRTRSRNHRHNRCDEGKEAS